MTDASVFPVKAINGSDLSHASLHSPYSNNARPHPHYHPPAHVESTEDDSISCICGFTDDDGATVACDVCNRWQHQLCYYPEFEDKSLPEDLAHYCVECHPRAVDATRARLRQQEKRGPLEVLTNGIKRNASKSHKKKIKEPTGTYTNGWPLDKVRHDRNSASPRDQPPPAKRPKTAHRTSDSTTTTTTTTKGHSRKRNASNVNHRRSLSRSPDSPIEQYSEEFLQCYQEDDWSIADANLLTSIGVTNALTEWLDLNDDEFRAMHGSAKGELLLRWDSRLEDIPGRTEIDVVENQDSTIQYRGQYPTWKSITVREPIAVGGYIGELKGHVGFKQDYQEEDSNRWARIKHPEPFVFFHPKLPLAVDARNEGTEMRYVRRSCTPNARLQILITGGADYHFCFMATTQIEPGDEVAVGWDIADGLPELRMKNGLTDDELEVISGWVSTALANCGPCACSLSDQECMMSRFDRRTRNQQDTKLSKGKKRKTGQHISPLNTSVNSRSGSEARKVDPDDDGTDSRSTSGSVGRGSASRDITPNTHYSANGASSSVPELSERERKKLAKEEEIFRRQEEEQGKQAKKKRNSAGSSLSTPSITSSKQLGYPANSTSKYADAGTSKQTGLPVKGVPGRKPKSAKPVSRPVSRAIRRSKPVYVDSETQCDMDQEEAALRAPTPSSRRRLVSKQQRLLDLCARNNHSITVKQQASRAPTPKLEQANTLTCEKVVTSSSLAPETVPSHPEQHNEADIDKDVDMADAPADDGVPVPIEAKVKKSPSESTDNTKQPAPVEPPDPPWPLKSSSSSEPEANAAPLQKPNNMHLQMPPPASNPFAQPAGPASAVSPNSTVVQSPANLTPGPLFSPAVTAAVAPSPARKKLSLSDYTRRKAKTQDHESKTDRESSPASTTSGPVIPPLQPSSSTEARAAEGGSAIDEDVRMEDVAA